VDATIGVAFASRGDADADALLHAATFRDVSRQAPRGAAPFASSTPKWDVALRRAREWRPIFAPPSPAAKSGPFYQPIVALPAQDLVGFEVLARWDSPEHGPVPPDIFIPMAEETGNDSAGPLAPHSPTGVLRRAELAAAPAKWR